MAINTACVSGNVGSSQLNRTSGGTAILTFSVAVNEWRKDADDYTSWITCNLFGTRADSLAAYIVKGTKVAVCGRLHQERWEKDGENRSRVVLNVNEIEFMSRNNSAGAQDARQTVQQAFPGAQVSPISDEDIPF